MGPEHVGLRARVCAGFQRSLLLRIDHQLVVARSRLNVLRGELTEERGRLQLGLLARPVTRGEALVLEDAESDPSR
jgi:hypothetical protein